MPRRKIIIFFVVNLILVSFLVHSFWPLICLLVEDGVEDQISRAEIPAPKSERIEELNQVVPKIIHQTYITCDVPLLLNGTCTNKEIPTVWKEAHSSCKDLHKDYEYKVGAVWQVSWSTVADLQQFWTDDNSRQFIVKE